MKKLAVLFLAITCVLSASAQEQDLPQSQSMTSVVDSLSSRLNKLQHDFDFLSCDYSLNKQITDLNRLSNSISLSSTRVMMDIYHGLYNRELYVARSDEYESFKANYAAQKENLQSTRTLVMLKILSSNFSEEKLNVLYACFNTIDTASASVEASLQLLDAALKEYRKLR